MNYSEKEEKIVNTLNKYHSELSKLTLDLVYINNSERTHTVEKIKTIKTKIKELVNLLNETD